MGEPERIESEDDLAALSADALRRRLRKRLRLAGLAPDPETRERHEENVPLAVWELEREWRADPTLDGEPVDLWRYVHARLRLRLLKLDAQQHPERYDPHGGYHPKAAPTLLGEDDINVPAPEREPDVGGDIVRKMQDAGIDSPATQLAVLRLVHGVQRGTVQNGRQAAKVLGNERYLTQPASQALAAAMEIAHKWEDAGVAMPPSFDGFLREL
jgi:hypothetical protein